MIQQIGTRTLFEKTPCLVTGAYLLKQETGAYLPKHLWTYAVKAAAYIHWISMLQFAATQNT